MGKDVYRCWRRKQSICLEEIEHRTSATGAGSILWTGWFLHHYYPEFKEATQMSKESGRFAAKEVV